MLRALGKLPLSLLQEAITLLEHGAKATVVARFVLSHEDLGDCPRLSDNSMRQYVQHLKRKVREELEPSAAPKRFLHQVALQIRRQQLHSRNVLLTRAALGPAEGRLSRLGSVPDVESLSTIKRYVMDLFWDDPKEIVQQLVALRCAEVQAKGAMVSENRTCLSTP